MMNSVTIRQALEFIGLLSTSPSNPYNLCNTFGIEVIDNEPINKDGYLVCDRGCKLIFVSSNITNRHRSHHDPNLPTGFPPLQERFVITS